MACAHFRLGMRAVLMESAPRPTVHEFHHEYTCGRGASLLRTKAARSQGQLCCRILIGHVGCIRPQRLPTTAPFNVCVYKVSDKAGDCWEDVQKYATYALYQVQIAHEARPSIMISLRDSFSDFLKEMSTEGDAYPGSLEVLRDQGCIKLVVSNKDDPESVGFVQSAS